MSQTEPKRAVAYLRVSSLSQVDGHSLDAQERLFHELCTKRVWTNVRVYREEGKSAHSESLKKRPVFRQLHEDARKGEFDIVVVHTLDRWSRNLRVTLESLAKLAMHEVALVSISENIDYSTPQGMLMTQLLGSFAQFFSNMLGTHVSKGLDQRAVEGRHTGGIPFGYQSCWISKDGERKRRCEAEHPGGVHLVEEEAQAIIEMFARYSTGNTTLSRLAAWLNESGFRTRNTRKLIDPNGNVSAGPKRFTTASVRNILHNPFYTGMVRHRNHLRPGVHDAVIGGDLFDQVQVKLRRNSGRSQTLQARPERDYLLKGVIRCAHCLMPMWAQTYNSGRSYYREHRESRSHATCPAAGGSIPCPTADEQIGAIVEAIELAPKWQEQVLSIISVSDEVDRVKSGRLKVQERLRRLGRAYVDGVYDDAEYRRQKQALELELESLVLPEADAAQDAGRLIEQFPDLWSAADQQERRKLLLTMLDAVYVDARDEKRIVAIKPKAPFRPIFKLATTRDGSGVVLVQDPGSASDTTGQPPPDREEADLSCSWWRRGRVELHLKHDFAVFLAA